MAKHYIHKYKYGKQTQPLTVEQLSGLMLKVKKERTPNDRHYAGIDPLRDASLLAVFYWTGLRLAEVVGDRPRRYKVSRFTPQEREDFRRKGIDWKKNPDPYVIRTSLERPGIRKEDILFDSSRDSLFITALAFKHGKRDAPLELSLSLPYVDLIKNQWERTKPGEKVWDLRREYAWEIIKGFSPKLYTHFYRLNRAMDFVDSPTTSPADLLSWFGWKRVQTAYNYLELGGRRIQKMSEVMVKKHVGKSAESSPVRMEREEELIEEPTLPKNVKIAEEKEKVVTIVKEGNTDSTPSIKTIQKKEPEKTEISIKDCPDCGGKESLKDGRCSECGYKEVPDLPQKHKGSAN